MFAYSLTGFVHGSQGQKVRKQIYMAMDQWLRALHSDLQSVGKKETGPGVGILKLKVHLQ